MKSASIVLDVLSFGAGMAAAWYWLQASRVVFVRLTAIMGLPESGDPLTQVGDEAGGHSCAAAESGRLNKWASILTAIAVALGTAGNLAGAWPLSCGWP